jgi:hypothetical protein
MAAVIQPGFNSEAAQWQQHELFPAPSTKLWPNSQPTDLFPQDRKTKILQNQRQTSLLLPHMH